jgi:hypothetical protein
MWAPLFIAGFLPLLGLGLCLVTGWRQRSMGLALLAGVFILHLVTAVRHIAVAVGDEIAAGRFVSQQIGANVWTAPVVHVSFNYETACIDFVLLTAVVLLARRLAGTDHPLQRVV